MDTQNHIIIQMDGHQDPVDGKIHTTILVGLEGGHHHHIPAVHLVDVGTINQTGTIQGKQRKYLPKAILIDS